MKTSPRFLRHHSSSRVSPLSTGTKNQDETGVDCGGVCTACRKCDWVAICRMSLFCGSRCFVASCTDDIQNQDETGVDCGGSCPQCGKSKLINIAFHPPSRSLAVRVFS